MARFSQELSIPTQGEALTLGQVKTFREILPMTGESWERLRLMIKKTLVIGTGAGPVALGGYQLIKGIILRTSRNELPISSPGMGLYYFNLFDKKVKPFYNPILAANGDYLTEIDLPFSFDHMSYKDDLLVQTSRYSHMELELTIGAISDILTAPGTAALTAKIDVILSRSKNPFLKAQEAKAKANRALPFIRKLAAFNPASQPYIVIESAEDLALFGFIAVAHKDATAGVSYSGTPDDCLDKITFRDNLNEYLPSAPVSYFQSERQKVMGNSGATLTGIYPYLFAQDGSTHSAYPTGKRSEIRLEIGALLGAPANPQVDVLIWGMRTLR